MPDISMCTDEHCPSRAQCWRFVAPPSCYQSYADFQRPEGAQCCEAFWPLDARPHQPA